MRRSVMEMGGGIALVMVLWLCALIPARAQAPAVPHASRSSGDSPDDIADAALPVPCPHAAAASAAASAASYAIASGTAAAGTSRDSESDHPGSAPSVLPSPAPAKPPLRLVIPYWPGSGADQVARVLARVWSEVRQEPVLVCNMPEHKGRTAIRWIAAAPADGRWLLLTSSPLIPADVRIGEFGDLNDLNDLSDRKAGPWITGSASRDRRPVLLPLARVGTLGLVTPISEGFLPGQLSLPGPIDGEMIHAAVRAWRGTESSALAAAAPLEDPPAPSPWPGWSDQHRRALTWNVMLAPPGTATRLRSRLRDELAQVLNDDRVRLTLASAGTELWPDDAETDADQRPRAAAVTTPLPPR